MLPPVSMVWPCSLSVDEYAQAGRAVEFPRLDCASCSRRLGFWSGYWRDVRAGGRCWRIWVRWAPCARREVRHALLRRSCWSAGWMWWSLSVR